MRHRITRTLILWGCLWGSLLAADGAAVWLDVPFVRQEKDGCGAASIAMVMQYWVRQQGGPEKESANPAVIQAALYSAPAHGVYASDVERYFQEHDFQTFVFKGEWADLKQHLEKGRPLMVALKPGLGSVPLHYVVVAGIDGEQELVMVNDPAQRKLLKQDRASFEREWSAAEKWTLLAVPRQKAR